ncbi:RDD family protein [Bacillus sp. WMMC1349]|uniref:RDD family protein n=1 Tax=Bacillus sp. WMMC1349 TaxID=2736254 RepID=UPI001551956F|nr:RDD family protein [Bacillus sp. WMMC1349]NPC92363.1 RDD family protein [Bacillus sp. WMMC1349]
MELSKHETAPILDRSEYAGIAPRFLAYCIDLVISISLLLSIFMATEKLLKDDSIFDWAIGFLPDSNDPESYFWNTVLMHLIYLGALVIEGAVKVFPGFIIFFLYYTLMESSKWKATIGKKIMRIQVVDKVKRRRISFGTAVGRFFGKFSLSHMYYIGFIFAFFTKQQQTLHDLLVKTIVIKNLSTHSS